MTSNADIRCRFIRISIHIPRVGDDVCDIGRIVPDAEFQSTSPVWGMTGRSGRAGNPRRISIHIPRVGDDSDKWGYGHTTTFQSTSPVWGMTDRAEVFSFT